MVPSILRKAAIRRLRRPVGFRFLVPTLVALLPVACEQAGPASPTVPSAQALATASTTVLKVPAALQLGAGTKAFMEFCVGEPLEIVGDGLFVFHQTTLADGSSLLVLHRNPMGVFAVGQVTGAKYRLGAADQTVQFAAPSGGFTVTATANLHVLGPRGSSGFFGHILLHVTVTPTGEVEAEIEVVDIHCT